MKLKYIDEGQGESLLLENIEGVNIILEEFLKLEN